MSRLLTHPHVRDVNVAAILHALSDPVRAGIFVELSKVRGGMNCTQTAAKLRRPMPKSTCSQHYRILREAGLILSERHGVDMTSRSRAAELELRFPGLLSAILASYKREASRTGRVGTRGSKTRHAD
jgi:DNA-binding transcriptional ArsR family regulator